MSDVDASEHERGLALFIAKQRRERFAASLAAGGKARARELIRLHASPDLDDRWLQPDLPTAHAEDFNAMLLTAVRRHAPKATRAYIVSGDPDLDGCDLPLDEALRLATFCEDGTLVSIVPGRVAVYTGEFVDDVLILVRASSP